MIPGFDTSARWNAWWSSSILAVGRCFSRAFSASLSVRGVMTVLRRFEVGARLGRISGLEFTTGSGEEGCFFFMGPGMSLSFSGSINLCVSGLEGESIRGGVSMKPLGGEVVGSLPL